MNDFEIERFLESLRTYHGATRIELVFSFDDGQEIRHICEDRRQ